MAGAGAAPQAGVTDTQAHGKHIDFPGLIAQQPALSYQATLICNSAPGGSAGPGAAGGFTGPDGDTGVQVRGTLGCGFSGRWGAGSGDARRPSPQPCSVFCNY